MNEKFVRLKNILMHMQRINDIFYERICVLEEKCAVLESEKNNLMNLSEPLRKNSDENKIVEEKLNLLTEEIKGLRELISEKFQDSDDDYNIFAVASEKLTQIPDAESSPEHIHKPADLSEI